MLKNLLYKEGRLAAHPTTFLFLLLSALILIPNYPYYVTFFYTALGIFFVCLNGRENHDIFYTTTLPIRKNDVVKARFLFVILVELAQILLAIPFSILRQSLPIPDNAVGIEPNLAFFGMSLVMLGLFNLVFFFQYYRAPHKVGLSFLWGSVAMLVYILLAESCVHAIPFIRLSFDTRDPIFLPGKLAVLAAGILLYVLLTALAYHTSKKSFEALDL